MMNQFLELTQWQIIQLKGILLCLTSGLLPHPGIGQIISGWILIIIALIALFPDFFSTQNPHKTSARKSFMPVQGIHFFHEKGFFPYAYELKGKRNKTTLKMEWVINESKIISIKNLMHNEIHIHYKKI